MDWNTALMIVGAVTTGAIAVLTVVAPLTKWTGDNWLLDKLKWLAGVLAPGGVSKKLNP